MRQITMAGPLLVLLWFWPASLAGPAVHNGCAACKDPRLNKSRPSVYVEFVKAGPRNPFHTDESRDGVWLRLCNNTVWDLVLPVFGVPDELGDVGVFYEVKARPESGIPDPPVGERRRHISSTEIVKAGRSLVFSIPREHLKPGLAITIQIFFEWEDDGARASLPALEHHVTYTSEMLGKEERKGRPQR